MAHADPHHELRQQLVEHAHLVHAGGFATATNGNLSARTGPGECLVSASGVSLGEARPEDFVLVDANGRGLDESAPRPSAEVLMHVAVYAQRSDVEAIVHAHPPISIALSIVGQSLDLPFLPEVVIALGSIPTLPYTLPASAETAAVVREAVQEHDALILERHGAVAVGSTLREARLRLETIEHTAHVLWLARQLGEATPLSEEQVARLRTLITPSGTLAPRTPLG